MNKETILLSDLQDLLTNKAKYFTQTTNGHTGVLSNYGEGTQGEYNETFKFYKHPGLPEGVFMRETYHTDSYGNGEALEKIEFVKGKEKTVTVFEPI